MSEYQFPPDRRYTQTHELSVGRKVTREEAIAVVESVKAAEDVYAPLSGEIVAINEMLPEHLEWGNVDPYGKGWFFKINVEAPQEYTTLLDAEAYRNLVEEL